MIAGQDTYINGVLTNILSGIASAGAVLARNTMLDLQKLHSKINLEENRLGMPNKIPMRYAYGTARQGVAVRTR